MKKFFLKYSVIIVLIIIVILGYFSGISIPDLLVNLGTLNFWQTIIIITWFLVIASLSITGKKLILYYLGYNVGYKNVTLIHFASISAHYSTPAKIGYPITVYLLKKLENIPLPISTATIVIELAVTVFIVSMVGLIGSLLYFTNHLKSLWQGLIILLLVILVTTYIFYTLYRKSKKFKIFFEDIKKALNLLSLKNIITYFIVQIVVQIAIAIHIVMITHFLESEISLWHAMISFSAAFFIGAVSMVPMGIGTRDISMVFYLSSFGVPSQIAIVVTVIQRVVTTGLGYLVGLISSGIIGVKSIYSKK